MLLCLFDNNCWMPIAIKPIMPMLTNTIPTALRLMEIPRGMSEMGVAVGLGSGVGVMIGVVLRGVRVGGCVVDVRVGVSVGGNATRMINL